MWLWLSIALAGDGPWALAPGDTNLYLGLDVYRYQTFRNGSDGEPIDMGSGLTGTGLTAVVTRGLRRGVEVELRVPYERVRANQPESAFCTSGPRPDWCEVSGGLGDLMALGKFVLMDEAAFRPVSIGLSAAFRSGEAYSENRGRLTTLGDGQTDVGGILSVGRTGTLPRGWWQASASGAYFYRLPHNTASPKIPADEVAYDAQVLVAPIGWFSIGPAVAGFAKLGGVDVQQARLDTLDGWASLSGAQLKVGGKAAVYSEDGLTFSVGVLQAVWARNNPIDTLALSAGIGWFVPKKADALDDG